MNKKYIFQKSLLILFTIFGFNLLIKKIIFHDFFISDDFKYVPQILNGETFYLPSYPISSLHMTYA
ncbi:hypothetical protein, partial [Crocosphaera sp. XPORK-15E]|uniref:hypothetical protein n=1 Tax=Crocosphaera sp. XPORK-15E TaxID=3110247 RepID=UPI002B1FF09F